MVLDFADVFLPFYLAAEGPTTANDMREKHSLIELVVLQIHVLPLVKDAST